ncbi:hypothetical protein [Streptacidiphilus cavernicola]|uniref:Uncharacterized protein n=1 Tax=Streptacidiphilus cavernicola TaxID=3342716 RepID=A0ABV6W2S8_9ACTN
MARSLPRPDSIIGYRKDGRPIRPILGASEDDTTNTASGGAPAVDQETLGKLLAREKEQGRRAASKSLLDDLGFASRDEAAAWVKAQRDAQTAQMSDVERREQAAADAEARAAQREAAASARERIAQRRAALVGLGATGKGLDAAERLLTVPDDADDQALTDAAAQLAADWPQFFGGQAQQPPAVAPGGSPAGGPPPRGGQVVRPGVAGLDMAKRRGYST